MYIRTLFIQKVATVFVIPTVASGIVGFAASFKCGHILKAWPRLYDSMTIMNIKS